MTALPPITDLTDAARTEGEAKTWFTSLRSFLSGLLGTSGDAADARAALGVVFGNSSSKTGAYTVVAGDAGKTIRCNGTFTVSITAAATLGDKFVFSVLNEGSGTITVDPNLSETVDGVTTLTVGAGKLRTFYCNGSGFTSIGGGETLVAGSGITLTTSGGTTTVEYVGGTVAAGTNYAALNIYADTAVSSPGTSYTELFNCVVNRTGSVKASFALSGSIYISTPKTGYARIYKNGAAVGTERSVTGDSFTTFTEDITVAAGDTLQIFAKGGDASSTGTVKTVKFGTSSSATARNIITAQSVGVR